MKLKHFLQIYDGEFLLRQHHNERAVTGVSILHFIPDKTKVPAEQIPSNYLEQQIYKMYPILADRDGRTQSIMVVIIL